MSEPTNKPVWWGPAVPHAVPRRDGNESPGATAFAGPTSLKTLPRTVPTFDELPPVAAPMLDGTADGFLAASLDTVEGAFAPAPTTSAFATAATSLLDLTGAPEALPGEVPHVESWDVESFGSDSSGDYSSAPVSAPEADETASVDDIVVDEVVVDEVVERIDVDVADEVVDMTEVETDEVVELVVDESSDDVDTVADEFIDAPLPVGEPVAFDAPAGESFEFAAPEGEPVGFDAPVGESFESAAPEGEPVGFDAPVGESFEFAAPEGEPVGFDAPAGESFEFAAPEGEPVGFDAPDGDALVVESVEAEATETERVETERVETEASGDEDWFDYLEPPVETAAEMPTPSGETFDFAEPAGEAVEVAEPEAAAAPLNYVPLVPKWNPNDFVAPPAGGEPVVYEAPDQDEDYDSFDLAFPVPASEPYEAPVDESDDELGALDAPAPEGEPLKVDADDDVDDVVNERVADVIALPVVEDVHDAADDEPLPLPLPIPVVVDERAAAEFAVDADEPLPVTELSVEHNDTSDDAPLPVVALADETVDEPGFVEDASVVAAALLAVETVAEPVADTVDEPVAVVAPALLADDPDESYTSDIPVVAPLAATAIPALLADPTESIAHDDVAETVEPVVPLDAIPAVVPLLAHDVDEEEIVEVVEEPPAPVLPPAEQMHVDAWEPPLSSFEAVEPALVETADEPSDVMVIDTSAALTSAAPAFDRVGLPIENSMNDDRTFAPEVGVFPPTGEQAASEEYEVVEYDMSYRAPRMPSDSSLSSRKGAESARDFAPEVSAFGFGEDVVAPVEEVADIYQPEPSEYQPGDVENGYVLNENYHWVPAAPPVSVGKMPAMWLDDPMVAGQRRYWDGRQWTEAVAQADSSVPEHSMSGAQTSNVAVLERPVRPTRAVNSFTAAAGYGGAGGSGGSNPFNPGLGPVATSPLPKRMGRGKAAALVVLAAIVAVVVIGGIAAVAVPMFFQQRTKAIDNAVMTDLTRTAHSLRTYVSTTHKFPKTAAQLKNQAEPLLLTAGDEVVILTDGHSGFCLAGYTTQGHYTIKTPKVYDSKKGGLQADGVQTCQTRWTKTLHLP